MTGLLSLQVMRDGRRVKSYFVGGKRIVWIPPIRPFFWTTTEKPTINSSKPFFKLGLFCQKKHSNMFWGKRFEHVESSSIVLLLLFFNLSKHFLQNVSNGLFRQKKPILKKLFYPSFSVCSH